MKLAAAALVAATAAPALADDAAPDPAAVSAGDANLESTARRKGRNLTLALGGGRTIGFGIEDAVGNGGSVSLRLAQVASERTLITVELGGVVLVHNVHKINSETCEGPIERATNQDTNLLVGVQFYVNRSLWIRGGAGVGSYRGHDVAFGSQQVTCNGEMLRLPLGFHEVTLAGPAVVGGIGLELARFKRWSLGLEWMSIGMANRDGLLSSSGVMLDAIIE